MRPIIWLQPRQTIALSEQGVSQSGHKSVLTTGEWPACFVQTVLLSRGWFVNANAPNNTVLAGFRTVIALRHRTNSTSQRNLEGREATLAAGVP